jgi:hypothetical protein
MSGETAASALVALLALLPFVHVPSNDRFPPEATRSSLVLSALSCRSTDRQMQQRRS